MATYTKQEKAEALEALRGYLKPGKTVYSIIRSVSRSGMSRHIDFYTIDASPVVRDLQPARMQYLSGWMAVLLGYPRSDNGLNVRGCGMDMAFATVYNLGRVLFPDGFAVVGTGRNGDTSGWDKNGGYALKSSIL